jgi:hypothetical protein
MRPQRTFGESHGLILRKIAAVLWFFLPLLVIVGLLLSMAASNRGDDSLPPAELTQEETTAADALQLVEVKFRTESYYSHVNLTYFDLQLEFDRPVYSGYVTVVFYDAAGNKTDEQDLSVTTRSYGSTDRFLTSGYSSAKGNVVSCEVTDFSEITYPSEEYPHSDYEYDYGFDFAPIFGIMDAMAIIAFCATWSFLRLIYVIPVVGTALFMNCKTYFTGGRYVTVYSGRFNHYVKVDGVKVDELSRLIPTSDLVMSASVGAVKVDVRISPLTRHISVKADGVLQMPV